MKKKVRKVSKPKPGRNVDPSAIDRPAVAQIATPEPSAGHQEVVPAATPAVAPVAVGNRADKESIVTSTPAGEGESPTRAAPPAQTDAKKQDASPEAGGSQRATRLPSMADEQHLQLLADLATAVWRLRQRMRVPGTEQPKEHLGREYRDFESVWDILAAMELEIHDHTGKLFDAGQSLRVAAWVPVAGIEQQRVQETIKPTIYCAGVRLQKGIVIVETPEKAPAT